MGSPQFSHNTHFKPSSHILLLSFYWCLVKQRRWECVSLSLSPLPPPPLPHLSPPLLSLWRSQNNRLFNFLSWLSHLRSSFVHRRFLLQRNKSCSPHHPEPTCTCGRERDVHTGLERAEGSRWEGPAPTLSGVKSQGVGQRSRGSPFCPQKTTYHSYLMEQPSVNQDERRGANRYHWPLMLHALSPEGPNLPEIWLTGTDQVVGLFMVLLQPLTQTSTECLIKFVWPEPGLLLW